MNLIQNILGYHSNEKIKILNFVNKNIPIFSDDTHWLGYGMYFWDNYNNSLYWKQEKERKNEKKIPVLIASANVITESILLDLTDHGHVKFIDRIWNAHLEKLPAKEKKLISNYPLGKRIDFLFKTYPSLEERYKAIKCFGRYKNNISKFDVICNNKITNGVKTIYCVRDENFIKNPNIIK